MTLWWRLAANDIAVRYQRSILGPFWITITMLVFVGAVGFLYAGLLNQNAGTFIHFVATGLVAWQFFSASVGESSSALISGRDMVLNTKVDPLVLVFRTIARNAIILLHNLPILLLTSYLAWPDMGMNIPLFLVGLMLLAVNTGWISVILAIASARFRDIPADDHSNHAIAVHLLANYLDAGCVA